MHLNSQLTDNRAPGAPLAHWFDRYGADIAGSTVFDSVGKQARPIQVGRCYQFSGSQYVDCGNIPALEIPFFILSFVFIRTGQTEGKNVMCIQSSGGNKGIIVTYNSVFSNTLSFHFGPNVITIPAPVGTQLECIFYRSSGDIILIANGVTYSSITIGMQWGDSTKATLLGAFQFAGAANEPIQGQLFAVQYAVFSESRLAALQKNIFEIVPGCEFAYKCDEQDGTVSYDSSGNGRHGAIMNTAMATFHATQNLYSYQNQVGYNKPGSVFIPGNEASPGFDVLGNPLQNRGRVKYNGRLKGSNCATFSGNQHVDFGTTPAVEIPNFIVSFWANTGESFPYSTLACIAYNDDSSTGRGGYRIRKGPSNNLMVDKGNGGAILAETSTIFNLVGAWNHFTIVYNNHVGQIYVDSVADGPPVVLMPASGLDYPPQNAPRKTALGCILEGLNQASPQNYFTGGIAGFQIAPYLAENLAKVLAKQDLDNPVFHAPLAEGAGATCYDGSVNARHGTHYNATLATWGTKQDKYHFNLMKGFTQSGAVRIPARGNGLDALGNGLTNPASRGHNGAETLVDFTGGVASPFAIQNALPTAFAFGNSFQAGSKYVDSSKTTSLNNFLVYPPLTVSQSSRVKNFLKQ